MLINKKSIIFGETRLAISCAEYLLDNDWSIGAVVTRDKDVIKWCQEKSIQHYMIDKAFQIVNTNCYLFSIINPYIISDKLIKHLKPTNLINYHDSFLPRYAGVNSTTWAILDNEQFHGISWHEITGGIDEGDIYYQKKISIDENDTAFSLNLKCTQAALTGFTKIISDIEQDKLIGIKQNLSRKTYFGRDYIPSNYGYINPDDNVSYINRTLNSLTFGMGYTNPISTVKINIDNTPYILEKHTPQTDVIDVDSSSCVLRNIYGVKINLNFQLAQIEQCILSDEEIYYLKKLKQNELHVYDKLSNLLSDSEIQSGLLAAVTSEVREELKIDLTTSAQTLCLFLHIILSKLTTTNTFIKVYNKNIDNTNDLIRKITEEISIMCISSDKLELPYHDMIKEITNEIKHNKFCLTKDFSYRYNINLCSEFAITDNYGKEIDTHNVVFVIKQNRLFVRFYQKDADFIKILVKTLVVLSLKHEEAKNYNELVKNISLLSKEEYQKIVYDWNATTKKYPSNKTIQQLFEEQVVKTPNNIAVVYEDIKLTYEELNSRCNQLATYLRETYQIVGDDLIALYLDRSEHILIAILAVLKAGAAYVPIDTSYPDERACYILEDTKAKAILSNQIYTDRLKKIITSIMVIPAKAEVKKRKIHKNAMLYNLCPVDSAEFQINLKKYSFANPKLDITSTNLAYVIYTSGTTGLPKGVMVEHSSIVNRISWMNATYPLFANDSILQKTPYVFDVSVWELFWSLWYGASVVVAKPELHKEAEYILDLIHKENISVIHFVPSMLRIFMDVLSEKLNNINKIKILRHIFCSGEVLSVNDVKACHSVMPDVKIHNLYGPTEASIDVLHFSDINKDTSNIYIGKPIANTQAYVLNHDLTPLPVGVIGELCLGGVGLARGYLNKSELTDSKFIQNPFQTEKRIYKNNKIYMTGDLVRYLPDGNLEYIGRNDFQVKIRGFRIELGEIENVLVTYPRIKHCVVIQKIDDKECGTESANNKYLVGYYVADNKLNEEKILNYISKKLPNYMVPTALVWIDKLPLTTNGKLDRNLLPPPQLYMTKDYLSPRSELEAKVHAVFVEVLNLPDYKVSITDNIFRIGGDSITSIQVVNKLRQRLNLQIRIEDIFNSKTIKNLYDNVISKLALVAPAEILSEQGILSGDVPLLPIQKWFWEQVKSGKYTKATYWNQSFLIKTPKLDIEILQQSIIHLVNYHDSFRLAYAKNELSNNNADEFYYKQHYVSDVIVPELKTLDLNLLRIDDCNIATETNGKNTQNQLKQISVSEEAFNLKLQDILTSWQSDFTLIDGQSYSVGYIYGYPDCSSRIFFALHHLLVDSVSWRIITNDLYAIYNDLVKTKFEQAGTNPNSCYKNSTPVIKLLGSKGTSYRQWASVVKEYGIKNQAEIDYWHEVMRDYAASKTVLSKLIESETTQNEIIIALDNNYTNLLLTKSSHAYNTQVNDLLLASLCGALYELIGNSIQHILLEGHGREEIDKLVNINHTVGWFTTMYPVRFDLPKSSRHNESVNIGDTIRGIKEHLRLIPNKGIGYGALFGYVSDNLPRISFNYLGQFSKTSSTNPLSLEEVNRIQDWQIVGERSGISSSKFNCDYNIININGYVMDDKLQFNIVTKLSQKNTNKFAKTFKNKIIELAEYTSNEKRKYLTRSDIGNIISQEYLDTIQTKDDIAAVYLANSLQQGFIYHALHQVKDTAYRVQIVFKYNNELYPERLKMAWQGAVNKYPSLRLRFAWQEELIQIVDKHQEIYWKYLDISQKKSDFQSKKIQEMIKEDRQHGYNLECGNLLRIYLIKQADDKYCCIMSAHHAILDGWSNSLLLKFVHELYSKLDNNMGLDINILEPEESYLLAQKHFQQNIPAAEEFWKDQINHIEEYANLNGLLKPDMYSVVMSEYREIKDHTEESIKITGLSYKRLKEFSSRYNITVNTVLEYVWHKLLSVYGNTKTTVVGTIISGRNLAIDDIEKSVGLYISTLPLIIKHNPEQTILESLKSVQNHIIEMNYHNNVSLVNLQKGGHRLFDSLFIYENHPIFAPNETDNNALKISSLKIIEDLDYPLGLIVQEQDNEIQVNLKYAEELFAEETINNLLDGLVNLVEQISTIAIENKLVKELSYLNEKEYQKIIYDWNKTDKDYSENKTIHQLFEEQVAKTPNNIAIVYEQTKLTYDELNGRLNQLANYLRETYKIQGDNLIALYLDRSEYTIITILAVLKAGAAYVPIDPNYPDERICYILEDTKVKIVLTNERYQDKLSNITRNYSNQSSNVKTMTINPVNAGIYQTHAWDDICIVSVDAVNYQNKFKTCSLTNPAQNTTSNNLAYIMYTSGTTGKPKGVMIEHSSALNTINNLNNVYDTKLGNKICAFTEYSFDISVSEFFVSLLNGAELHLLSGMVKQDIMLISNYFLKQRINYAYLPPVMISNLQKIDFPNLVGLIYAGEPCAKNVGEYWSKKIKLYNYYGPTETSIYSIGKQVIDGDVNLIGKPIANTTAYILDQDINPLPIGSIGELHIGGHGLARGYLNQPGLTANKFIVNPFQTILENTHANHQKLYKTGDLVRYRPNGDIEYIGRNDFQVKIRGFRIELGEIENVLNTYDGIKQSIVITEEHVDSNGVPTGNRYLVAYYTAISELNKQTIMNYLSNKLPDYMVPNVLIWLENLPLTINGKLDKSLLPRYQKILQHNYMAPSNVAELKICTIYSEVLSLSTDQVGVTHNFFELGGNSILAINLLYKLQQDFKITLNDIFKLKTPARIAKLARFTKNSLYHRLKQIKLVYDRLASYKISSEMLRKKTLYLEQIEQMQFTEKIKNINVVLLTGSTGHLGCHILYQLLCENKYKIYLLIRASSDIEAYARVNNKFKFYFSINLDEYQNRIVTIAADLEKPHLGLNNNKYQELISNVDSVMHSAALVKHYGDYATFYQANVQSTINLLELTKRTRLKEFHYISTLSILANCHTPNCRYHIWIEDDNEIGMENNINTIYIKTKYEGELAVIKYREFGVNGNIYRVGNLAMNSQNYRNQENIEENAFFTRIKTILNFGMMPKEVANIEISPVDCTALAITKLFNQVELSNKTYHIANPQLCNLSDLFAQCDNVNVKTVTFEEFIDALLVRLNNTINRQQIERFMLHQMWLEDVELDKVTQVVVLQNKTDEILSKLNFNWPQITPQMISGIINQAFLGNKKMKKKEPIFEYLESIAELIPAAFYWLDLDGRTMGLNKVCLKVIGAAKKEDLIGKTPYEMYKNESIADGLQKVIDQVIQTGEIVQAEDVIVDVTTGKLKYFSATRAPLRNKKDEIIGVVGTSIDITSEKETEELRLKSAVAEAKFENEANKAALAEKEKLIAQKEVITAKLMLENEANKAALAQKEAEALRFQNEALQVAAQEQEKFRTIVKQVMHDITSPIVSIENIVSKLNSKVPETDRVTLRHAVEGINEISHKLLSQYNDENLEAEDESFLAALAVLQIINEKREGCRKNNVAIEVDIAEEVKFMFIKHNPGMFKRMISNLTNNAVDALKNRTDGKITVMLGATPDDVVLVIKDNGPGMPKHIIDKFKQGIEVTEGKENGHGVGLTQVRDAITSGNGTYKIYATNEGTKITIWFPKVATPSWLSTEIKLTIDDTVLILDDDKSIHGLWTNSFKSILEDNPTLKTKHFTKGKEVVKYINKLTSEQKENTFLLTDYELIDQGINGLEVVAQTKMHRAILVTSYASSSAKQIAVTKYGIKMLPKELAAYATIKVDKKIPKWSNPVDIVWVEDIDWFVNDLVRDYYSDLKVDVYYDPVSFMDDVHQYPLGTRIILDNNYASPEGILYDVTGYDLAEKLHKMGYTKLILLTGEAPKSNVPEYLTVLRKADLEALKKLDKI